MDDRSPTISAAAQARLDEFRRKGESYSDAIMRLTRREKWTGFDIANGDPNGTRRGMRALRESIRRRMDQRIGRVRKYSP